MRASNENRDISIVFSEDEAIVFFEWLHKFNEEERPGLTQDQAEERLLFDLEAELEKVVSSAFSDNYKKLLLKARERIRDKE
jgi:hypothetical protein